MNRAQIPITERSNLKSIDIDIQESTEITKILSDCESEIFGGYENYEGVFDKTFIENCLSFSKSIKKQLDNNGSTNIVLIGAGTSGRLCRLMAKVLKPMLEDKINIIPIIAGGIKALVRAEPNTEDRLQEGIDDYLNYTQEIDRSNCFVIGVSCGLSANYVRGALEEANKYSSEKTAMIGFNPIELATVDISEKILILNPIIGPEPIVGSVRMKGGTATMIMLYALLTSAVRQKQDISDTFLTILKRSKAILSKLQKYNREVSSLIELGGESIRSNGNVYLLGSPRFGALCIYDAAECPPTFGAKATQMNGFSQHGVDDLVYYNYEAGEKMAKEINLEVFFTFVLPTLKENDTVLTIESYEDEKDIFSQIKDSNPTNYRCILVEQATSTKRSEDKYIVFREEWDDKFYQLLFIRSLLGQLSTGIFTLNGKIYENKMTDLRITNKKLFFRAIRIITEITDRTEDEVRNTLLKTIYDGTIPDHDNLESHITLSANKENIVPLTILSLIYPQKDLSKLKELLSKQPVIRKLIKEELKYLNNIEKL